jgi:putative hydrolase of HD superfamily
MTHPLAHLHPFIKDFLVLKKLRRTGWQLRGIPEPESLADHCFGVALLTLLLAGQISSHALNRDRAAAIALVHELAESRVGDIPFTALGYLREKAGAEMSAMQDLLAPLGNQGEEWLALFREFETGSTPEARFVRAVDKLEMLITAADYEHRGIRSLHDFWTNETTFATIAEFPELAAFAQHLREEHNRTPPPTPPFG